MIEFGFCTLGWVNEECIVCGELWTLSLINYVTSINSADEQIDSARAMDVGAPAMIRIVDS